MADIYTLNPNQPISTGDKDGHSVNTRNTAFIAVGAIVLFGLIYWWGSSVKPAPVAVDEQAALRSQVAAMLNSAPPSATPQEINTVASQLQSSPKASTAATSAARSQVAAMLRSQ